MSESESVAESLDRDDRGRFVIESEPETVSEATEPATEPESEPEPAPEPESEPEKVEEPSASVAKPAKKRTASSVASSALEGEIVMSALVFEAPMRNSASVRLLQERLAELGHGAVRRDRPGWLSDGTVEALKCFQEESSLEVTGEADSETVEALTKGTKVKVSA